MSETRQGQLYRANSVVVVLFASACAVYALSLPMGSLSNPGAGMWPFIISMVMGIAALALLITERSSEDYEPLSKRTWIIVAGFGLMALFVLGFTNLGLTLPSLLSFVWMRWMAGESWRTSIILSILFTAIYVVTFSILLGVPMPYDVILDPLLGR